MPSPTAPAATYRLQLNAGFTFAEATAIVDYLAALGISHCYTSNYLKAVPGSSHGYDVADPTQLNPEIGDQASYARWVATLRAHGMGHIIDLVPNHMGIAKSANPWWQDVLENGPSSRYAHVFDIDWQPLKQELDQKVLLPILGAAYGTVLEQQEIRLEYQDGAFCARYYEHVLPIAPGTYDRILALDSEALLQAIGDTSDEGSEFLSILTAIRRLPGRDAAGPDAMAERDREKEVIKRRLAALTARAPRVLEHVERAVAALNGQAGQPHSFDGLDALLAAQPYRLSYWRVAAEEINYRRFFDINELAAIRMEDPAVFDLTHAYAFELLQRGDVDGFRIDHVDGLYDPADYLRRLQSRACEVAPGRFSGDRPLYVVVEKILGLDEPLPDWPVDGTTGYEFLVRVNNLFVDGSHGRPMTEAYDRFARVKTGFPELAYRGKQLTLRMSMSSELNVLASQLNRLSEGNRHYRDFTLNSLTYALREVIACFPVYRTYVNAADPVSDRDRGYIERAVRDARRRNPRRPGVVFDFVRDLLLKNAGFIPEGEREEHMRFVGKFQQVTSPVTAKGIEDTALYVYNRLVSLNEVGGEPDVFGAPPEALHAWLRDRAARWPHALSTSSTHDTKRSEDVRARINVLSEIPGAWKQATARWARMNRKRHALVEGTTYPSRNEEYLLYQTLVGTWPLDPMSPDEERLYADRIRAYMLKAMREAKVYTSWLNPSEPHEQAMDRFVEAVLSPSHQAFRQDFQPFARLVAHAGIYNSLSQLAIKITAPGVPDFYQGCELWDFSLVDPDNRRPVDYTARRQLLAQLDDLRRELEPAELAARLLAQPADPIVKLYATTALLHARRARDELFRRGDYRGLAAGGERAAHVFAFCRQRGGQQAITAVPRLVGTLLADPAAPPVGEPVWDDTWVEVPGTPAAGHFVEVLTGTCVPVIEAEGQARVRAADLFRHFPVAVIEGR
ncbi:MAG: malto-oligosyltrehalose synthase [Vicinamibacterales bacterium]